MKPRIKSAILNIRKQKTPNQSRKKIRIQKSKDGVRSLWDNFKRTNIRIMGVPEVEERKQETENLFEKITTGNFPKK